MSQPREIPPRCQFEPDGLILKLDLVVPSDVRLIDELVMNSCSLLGGTPCGDALQKIELALHEALANAVVHGNRHDPTKATRVCLAVREDCRIDVVVKDVGAGFSGDQLPNPLAGDNLFASHGRGIFLMRRLMDEVEYRYHGGTEIHLRYLGVAKQQAGLAVGVEGHP